MITELHKNYAITVRSPVTDEDIDVECTFYFTCEVCFFQNAKAEILEIFLNGYDISWAFSYNDIKHIEGEILVQMLGDYYVCE